MDSVYLFPWATTWWLHPGFVVCVLAMLALDLGVFHRQAHEAGFKESAIGSALVFRILFITAGAALMQCHWMVIVFGVFLLLTGVNILIAGARPLEPEKNPVIKLARQFLRVTPQPEGQRFFVPPAGRWHATPLFVALIVIEVSAILFAVDPAPAIFAGLTMVWLNRPFDGTDSILGSPGLIAGLIAVSLTLSPLRTPPAPPAAS